jgi:hypothetical protein
MQHRVLTSHVIAGAVALFILTGCAAYYIDSNLNGLGMGSSKEAFFNTFPAQPSRNIAPPVLRAAKRQNSGDLIEVFTLPMLPSSKECCTEYWFVFKNNQLVQWGRPEDWKAASASYDINFNPASNVRAP